MKTHKSWKIQRFGENVRPGRNLVRQLCSGDVAVAVFKSALTPSLIAESQLAIDRFRGIANKTDYVNGSLTTIGQYLAKHINNPSQYFSSASTVEEQLFRDAQIPRWVRQFLAHRFSIKIAVASEDDGRKYAGAIVRLHADGVCNPLHNDNIARDARHTGLAVAKVTNQLSCVVCLQECTTGGALHHYQKAWNSVDEQFKIPNGLGYYEQVVADCPAVTYKPSVGDIYVMNPTYYHSISAVGGTERRTLGFFFGSTDEDLEKWIAWS
jgi:hypothetical protein